MQSDSETLVELYIWRYSCFLPPSLNSYHISSPSQCNIQSEEAMCHCCVLKEMERNLLEDLPHVPAFSEAVMSDMGDKHGDQDPWEDVRVNTKPRPWATHLSEALSHCPLQLLW